MGSRYCIICRRNKQNCGNASMFGFPKCPKLRKKWLDILKLEEKDVKGKQCVCDNHFHQSQKFRTRLKRGAIPKGPEPFKIRKRDDLSSIPIVAPSVAISSTSSKTVSTSNAPIVPSVVPTPPKLPILLPNLPASVLSKTTVVPSSSTSLINQKKDTTSYLIPCYLHVEVGHDGTQKRTIIIPPDPKGEHQGVVFPPAPQDKFISERGEEQDEDPELQLVESSEQNPIKIESDPLA